MRSFWVTFGKRSREREPFTRGINIFIIRGDVRKDREGREKKKWEKEGKMENKRVKCHPSSSRSLLLLRGPFSFFTARSFDSRRLLFRANAPKKPFSGSISMRSHTLFFDPTLEPTRGSCYTVPFHSLRSEVPFTLRRIEALLS